MSHTLLLVLVLLGLFTPYKIIHATDGFCESVLAHITPNDGLADDVGLQTAITNAQDEGVALCFPSGTFNFDNTIEIPAGIQLYGAGSGYSNGVATGTIIKYSGTGWAMKITGHSGSIKHMTIIDENSNAEGGLRIEAQATGSSGAFIESVNINNIVIANFKVGTGLQLFAEGTGVNGSAITYGTFYDVAIHNALTGIEIIRTTYNDYTFINSNKFIHGRISADDDFIPACGLCIRTGNNNVFDGMVVSLDTSSIAHLAVYHGQGISGEHTEFVGNDMLIEAPGQAATGKPIIYFEEGVTGSKISGILADQGLIESHGANLIEISGPSIFYQDSGVNILENSGFIGVIENNIPGWTTTSSVNITSSDPEIMTNHNVLYFNDTTTLKPISPIKAFKNNPSHAQVKFGAYIKTSTPDVVRVYSKDNSSITHPGDGKWHFLGTTSYVDLENITGDTEDIYSQIIVAADTYVTMPTFSFGYRPLSQITSAPLSKNGGQLYGTLTQATNDITNSNYNSNTLTLPDTSNIYFIDLGATQVSIDSIDGLGTISNGTYLTLVFNNPVAITSATINTNSNIKLTESFSGKGVLEILKVDDFWVEVSRTNL